MENPMPVLIFVICAVLFLAGWVLAWIVNKIVRRRVLNQALVGTLLTLPGAFLPVIALFRSGTDLSLFSPEQQGEMVGAAATPIAFVFGVGLWLTFRESRKATLPVAAAPSDIFGGHVYSGHVYGGEVYGGDATARRRSPWSIAAFYLGLCSLLFIPAPFALAAGLIALRDIKKRPQYVGRGSAITGIVLGSLGSVILLLTILSGILGR